MGLYQTAALAKSEGGKSEHIRAKVRSTVAGNPRPGQPERCEQKRLSTKEERCPLGQSSWQHEGATAKSLLMCKAVPTARSECRSRSLVTRIPDKWPSTTKFGLSIQTK